MKKELQNIKQFIKEHQKAIIILFIISLCTYGYKLFHYSITIDTETLLTIPKPLFKSWIAIGRPVLVLMKYLLGLHPMNIFFAELITYLCFTNFVIFLYYIFYRKKKKPSNSNLLIFGSIILTSAIYIEQLCFTLQSAEVALALNIFCLAVLFFQKGQEEKKQYYYIMSIPLLCCSFGTYQSFVPLFISVIAIITFQEANHSDKKLKEIIAFLFPAITIFIISLLGYFLGCAYAKSFIDTNSTYLTEQIKWFQEPISDTVNRIIEIIKDGYLGVFFKKETFYNALNVIALLGSFYYACKVFIKKEKQKTIKILLITSLLLVPFILSIVLGTKEVYRAQLSVPVMIAFLISYIAKEIKDKKIYWPFLVFTTIAIILQFKTTHQLLVTDYFRYLEDEKYAMHLYEKLSSYNIQEKRLVMLGAYTPDGPLIGKKGEVLGYSFFEWDEFYITGVGERAGRFMQTLGYPITPNTIEDFNKAKEYEDILGVFPKENSIIELEDIIIVKLS